MKIAKKTAWSNESQTTLHDEGHPEARFLVAAKGRRVADHVLEGFGNQGEFFSDLEDSGPEKVTAGSVTLIKGGTSVNPEADKEEKLPT
jgi:hypothetical protein